ncbi:MAG: crotonase/enoyl-CoA hydratase family protein [Alphaproteobacteria bacterium]
MSYETVRAEVADAILTLTLNRPDRLNAFTETMMHEMIDVFDRADADDGVRAIIVTGEGRAFCAGADLGAGGDSFDRDVRAGSDKLAEGDARMRDGGGRVALRIFNSIKPVIAAVNGPAVGVGATMQLPMDVRLASEDARFGFVFSRRGLVPEACSSWFLPRVVGISQALEWVFSGRVFSAREALDGGLVKALYKPEELMPAARELAREIAENTSAVSVALSRQMMWRMAGADHPMQAHRVDSRGIYAMGKSADVREGVESFLEKRKPHFPMKPSTDMPDFFPWWDDPEFR